MEIMTQLFGRFHPLLVHLPIGIILLAFVFECISVFPKYKNVRHAIQPALLIGALSAIASAGSGYFLSLEGGYEESLLGLHRNSGIATAVFASLFYFLRKNALHNFQDKTKRKMARMVLFSLLVLLVSFTGHLGGSLTHGEKYLFGGDVDAENSALSLKISSVAALDSANLFADVIEPILRARCYGCHSATKQKGQLRLDQHPFILKGGKHGAVIVAGVADSSAMFARLTLPVEDEHHMPPNKKAQPSSAEIALVQSWIQDGASFDKRVGAYGKAANIRNYVAALLYEVSKEPILPLEDAVAASPETIEALKARGILVIPLAEGSNYLSVSFVNAREATDGDIEMLVPLRDQLLWLDLGRTKITEQALKTVATLVHLTQLNLEYTAAGDDGMKDISLLADLVSLNLVGTKVSDKGLSFLAPLKKLQSVFLYETNITAEGTRQFARALPTASIDTGSYQLQALDTDTIIFKGPR